MEDLLRDPHILLLRPLLRGAQEGKEQCDAEALRQGYGPRQHKHEVHAPPDVAAVDLQVLEEVAKGVHSVWGLVSRSDVLGTADGGRRTAVCSSPGS